jgi:two-component system CheB/CheR fusion protein
VRPLRVLVVDDNEDAAASLALLLRMGQGHQTRAAHDGLGALLSAQEFRPDVVLLDLALPGGLDGYEVARRLRELPATQGALLIALTGYGQEEAHRRSRAVGFDAHLVKPVDLELLGRLILQGKKRG